ncbi:MAG: Tim44-like domain-containing protein [Betaproteobacteria bacterium]|nr:Tim44-like domain-containing protein [Betaproteobacteria bacterium]
MKRIAIALFAVVMGTGLMVQDAEAAKRLGGGKSTGISRDSTVMKRDAIPAKPAAAPTAAAPAAAAPAAAAQSGMSRWMGPLAGLAAGIGLAALFSHLGLGEGMVNIVMMLLLGAAIFFAVRWFLSKRQSAAAQPALQYAGAGAGNAARANFTPARFESTEVGGGTTAAAAAASAANIPAGFDTEGFLRQAKLNFIRLQAANDRGDMEDIRQFCSPEMAAEIQVQFQERNQLAQETDVVQLDAELLDVSTEANHALASVRFSGQIREEANAAPEAFSEVWHLSKPVDGSRGWTIAGIQQD